MFHSERSFKDFLLGLAIGGSIGTLMFNTKQGKKIQKEILSKYHKMSKNAHHFFKDGIDKLTGHAAPKHTAKRRKKRR